MQIRTLNVRKYCVKVRLRVSLKTDEYALARCHELQVR